MAGDTLTLEQMRLAVNEKRVLAVRFSSVEGEVEAWFGFTYTLEFYSVSKTLLLYIVFPKPIPRELRMRAFQTYGCGKWDDVADVYAAFGIHDRSHSRSQIAQFFIRTWRDGVTPNDSGWRDV